MANLKKQSQFAAAQIDVKSYLKVDYGNKPACGAQKNKAKQSQLPTGAFRIWNIRKGREVNARSPDNSSKLRHIAQLYIKRNPTNFRGYQNLQR